MRKQTSVIFFLALAACSSPHVHKKQYSLNSRDLPEAVLSKFEKRHPGVNADYRLYVDETDKSIEAEFTIDSKNHSERYTESGTLVEVEQEIAITDIPIPVKAEIESYLRENDCTKIQKVQLVKTKTFHGYEIKVKTPGSNTGLMEYFFEINGALNHFEEVELVSIPTLN
jgi:hypothetical protein